MENGFIRLPRTLFKSAAWQAPRVFSSFEAFLDLLQLAYWRSGQYFHNGRYIPLEPGDMITTSSRLALRWGWPRDEVRRWLKHLASHRVLSGTVVEGRLKISLDPYCNAHFTQLPAASPLTAPGTGGKGGVLSSPEEKEKNLSSVSHSPAEIEQQEEGKTEEDSKPSFSEEEKKEGREGDTRAREIAEQLVKSVVNHARPRHAANDFHENSERLAELREHCEAPPTTTTEFPPDFPMDEFRKYVDDALRSPDRNVRPHLRQGWLAELRDRFLAERVAA